VVHEGTGEMTVQVGRGVAGREAACNSCQTGYVGEK
jgi:hypothetical protein